MIPPGTKYVITGVHKEDASAWRQKKFLGATIESISLKRWGNNESDVPRGYWYGLVRYTKQKKGLNCDSRPGETYHFYAVYLRRVKEEAKP